MGEYYEQSKLIGLQQQANLKITTKMIESGIDIDKKAANAKISLEEYIQKLKGHSDLSAERELQRTIISLSADGEIFLQKEQFGDSIKKKFPFTVTYIKKYCRFDDVEARGLLVVLKMNNGKECTLFWNLQKLEPRCISMPFERNGISFGFGEKKEKEIREKFFMYAINVAETICLPNHHGWYRMNERWYYAFPGDFTWKEIEKCW